MDLLPPSLPIAPNQHRDQATARLRGLIPTIMERWEARVRSEVHGAANQQRPVLHNDVPEILAEITQALALDRAALFTDSDASREHAHQRLRLRAYSVQEIIQEYQILRQVLMDVLQEEVPLDPAGAALVHVVLDQSIQEAVTEYVRLQQEELRESEERYRLLVEGVKDYAIFMVDPQGCVTSWNEGARRIFGFTAEEIVSEYYGTVFTPEDRAAGRPERELERAAASGQSMWEGWHIRKGGEEFWATDLLTALYGPEGQLRGFSKVTRDITERKYLEDQLHHRADELAQADRRRSEFVAMVAHELRTPLAAITNALYILENMQLDTRGVRQLQAAARQTRQLNRLVEDLLDISRINTGKLRLKRQPLTFETVVRGAVDTVRPFVESRGQELLCTFSEAELSLLGDAARLEQVVTNLLNNAAKYSEPGGEIWLTLEREGDQGVLRVRDSGIGIDAALLPTIFDLFAQADPQSARSHGGLGIGLSLVKRLVELHDGTVEAHSGGASAGAEFVVRLPLVPLTESPGG